jgi:hypothetical protein
MVASCSVLLDIASSDAGVRLRAVKELKNQVIGNKSKKAHFVKSGAVPHLLQLLSTSSDATLLVQSATALGSLSLVHDGARAIVQHDGLRQLLGTLDSSDPRLVEAGLRALKLLLQSGQMDPPPTLPAASHQRLAALLSSGTSSGGTSTSSSSGGAVETAACVLATACCSEAAARLITEAGAVPPLLALLGSPLRGRQEAALAALAALASHAPRASPGASPAGAAPPPAEPAAACHQLLGSPAALQQLLALLRDQQPRVRVLACSLASNLARASPPPPADCQAARQLDALACLALPALLRLLPEQEAQQDGPPLLAALLQARPELQAAACDAGAVWHLSAMLADGACSGRRLAGALGALGALCMHSEERRLQLAARAPAVAAVAAALDAPEAGVRAAAALCVRALTRSIRAMRQAALHEGGAAQALVRLLGDADVEVASNAAAAACNLALEFSPARAAVVAAGGVAALAALASSMFPVLRLNSCWALSNLAFRSSADIKRQVGWGGSARGGLWGLWRASGGWCGAGRALAAQPFCQRSGAAPNPASAPLARLCGSCQAAGSTAADGAGRRAQGAAAELRGPHCASPPARAAGGAGAAVGPHALAAGRRGPGGAGAGTGAAAQPVHAQQ